MEYFWGSDKNVLAQHVIEPTIAWSVSLPVSLSVGWTVGSYPPIPYPKSLSWEPCINCLGEPSTTKMPTFGEISQPL